MKFDPCSSYGGLLKQAYSLARLVDTKEQQIKLLNDQLNSVTKGNLRVTYDNMELDSLREMNQMLTNRMLCLEEALGNLSNNISTMNN